MNLIEKNTIELKDKIWKIIESESIKPKLLFELRNIDTKKMSIGEYCFETNSFRTLFNDLDWWLSIQFANENTILFQYFDPEKMPYSSKIVAYSIQNQIIKWEKENTFFVSANKINSEEIIINETINETQSNLLINTETGNVISSENSFENNFDEKIILYKEKDKYFTDLQGFIFEKTNQNAIKLIEYCEWQCFILISYYICRSENSFENYLLIINEKGSLHLSETLGITLKGVASGTFSVYKDYLYFVNADNQIKILTINK